MFKLKLFLFSLLLSCSTSIFAANGATDTVHAQLDPVAALLDLLHGAVSPKEILNILTGSKDLLIELIREHKTLSCCATATCLYFVESYPGLTFCTASSCLWLAILRKYCAKLANECNEDTDFVLLPNEEKNRRPSPHYK